MGEYLRIFYPGGGAASIGVSLVMCLSIIVMGVGCLRHEDHGEHAKYDCLDQADEKLQH
jgi:hypothetical protein